MYTSITRNRIVRILFAISFLSLSSLTFGQAEKEASGDKTKTNQIVIKDFHFDHQVLTVRSGDKITWINRDEEPHTVVSVEKQFKKSSALDTDQEFTITAGAPGTYTYYCSVHPKMTGTIVVVESSTTTQLYEINTLFAAIETRPANCSTELVLLRANNRRSEKNRYFRLLVVIEAGQPTIVDLDLRENGSLRRIAHSLRFENPQKVLARSA